MVGAPPGFAPLNDTEAKNKEGTMSRRRTIGLFGAIAAAALASGPATAAASLPEFNAPFPSQYLSFGGHAKLETHSGSLKINCTHSVVVGTIEGPNLLGIGGPRLRGCTDGTNVCTVRSSNEPEPGEISLATIGVTLGYVNQATKRVGLKFAPGGFEHGLISIFDCGSSKTVEVRGSFIGEWTPVNEVIQPRGSKIKGAKGKLVFKMKKKGTQSITSLEGEPAGTLRVSINGAAEEEAALSQGARVSGSSPIEVKA